MLQPSGLLFPSCELHWETTVNMIKFILNGSFRSGTTVLWKIMRESNPDMYVFWEPLNNELFLEIHREQNMKLCEHGGYVTTEYITHGEDFLKSLRQTHPLIGEGVFTFKANEVIDYLKIFESLGKPVILQPNRMHFIISNISKTFDCKVAHLIRHPLDVFNSVMFSSPKLKYLQKTFGVNLYLLRLLKASNQFFLNEQCNFILHYFGLLPNKPNNKYLHPKRYLLERFLLAWTISNWYAVAGIDSVSGMIVRYEDCVAGDGLQALSNFSDIQMISTKVKLHSQSIRKYTHKDLDMCYMLAEKVGILENFRCLMERFNYM